MTKDIEEFRAEFLELEKELDLLNKKVCDTYFWERIRFPIYQRLYSSDEERSANGGSEGYLPGIYLFVKNIFVKNPLLSKKVDFLFYGTGRRKKIEDGLWWDIYHDPIIESTKEDCLLWERPYDVSHLTPSKTSSMRYVDVIEYTGTLLQKTGLSKVSLSESELSLIKEVKGRIEARFDAELPLKKIIKEDLSKRRVRLPLYTKLIKKVSPKVVFLTVGYNGRETFIEACRRADVPVVELQHGVINEYHMGYSFPHANKNVFADYFFTFGDFWSDSVDLPLSDEDVYSIGYPYLEKKSKQYKDVEQKNQILFISGPNIGEELSRFAVELNNRERYKKDIVYKLHPNEKTRYPWLEKSDITCIADETPLYRLFAESDSQIGVNSTALYEGLQFGLSTYVLETPGHEYMQYLIENNYVALVQSTEELINEEQTNRDIQKEYFFEDNPLQKFESAVNEITN
jgi:hypothetical protein